MMLCTTAGVALAQGVEAPQGAPLVSAARVGFSGQTAPAFVLPEVAGPLAPQAGANDKDAFAAVALSFLIPGVGSFYAGNNKHGWRHLAIHVASYAVMVATLTSCVNDYYSDCSEYSGGFYAGSIVLVGNWVWGMFTANSDVKEHNGQAGAPKKKVVGAP
jgi:hypothetical protein